MQEMTSLNRTSKSIIERRASARAFDATKSLSDAQILELLRLATLSPSAYNLQNWSFKVVRSVVGKSDLLPLCYGQLKVVQASAVVIVCGQMGAYDRIEHRLEPCVKAGALTREVAAQWSTQVRLDHDGNRDRQREEAIRSASMAAMTLMLAAEEAGLASCPMGGFDPVGVSSAFSLPAETFPVVLVALGYALPSGQAQKPRTPVEELVQWA